MTTEAVDPLVLHPSRTRSLVLLAIGAVFTVTGVVMIRAGNTAGWFVASFFALCTVAFVTLLVPNSSYLRLTRDGFEIRSMFRSFHYQWSDVDSFYAGRVGLNPMVLIRFAPSYAPRRKLRAAAAALTGAEAGLSDTYGRRPEDLAALLNDWRARHAALIPT